MIDIYKVMECIGRIHINEMPTGFMPETYGRLRPFTPIETILIRQYSNICHPSEAFNSDI